MKIIQTFLFETDFYEQIRHKLSFIYKNNKVCTQLRILQKEIKSTLNQELMHILRERAYLVWVIILYSLDAPKSVLETEKNLKTLSSGQIYKKTQKHKKKRTKNQKNQKKPTGLVFF